MFDPHNHTDLFKAPRKKRYCIVILSPDTEEEATTYFTSARNPNKKMMDILTCRGFSDEVYVVRLSDLEVITEVPPLIPRIR